MMRIVIVMLALLMFGGVAAAETTWRLVDPDQGSGEACLEVGGEAVAYHRLDGDQPTVLRVKGPRRVKIVTRYLYADGEATQPLYTLTARVDGASTVVRSFETKVKRGLGPCEGDGRVGVLRRAYVSVPSGWHDVSVTAEAPGGGAVAARFLRELRKRPVTWVAYAPERFAEVNHLQFDSGNRTSYYLFDAATPLACTVTGPTTLKVSTRLDFDHTMSGTQPYAIEVRLDGEAWRTFQYDTRKLTAARWVERDHVLPGVSKTMTLKVPRGSHRIELRCLRPLDCGVAARVRIPERDIR